MNKPLRLSPSGPVVDNDAGGPFAPGPGCRVRLVQGQCTVSADTPIPTIAAAIGPIVGVTALTPVLDAPNVALRYRASVRCDVSNPATVQGTVTLYLDTSTDASSWTNVATNEHIVSGGGLPHNGAREISLDLLLTAGAALGVTSSPASPNLYVRARISAPVTGGANLNLFLNSANTGSNSAGTILIELEETL